MKRSFVIAAGLLALATLAPALVLDHAPAPLPDETFGVAAFRIHVPDDVAQVRGILFRVAPHLSDSRPEVNDPALMDLCAAEDFALLGAQLDDVGMETGVGDALLRTLAVFAAGSGHPELEFATLYLEGYSWGGQFSYHFTVWRPQRVLGFVTMKGGYHRSDPAGAAILVPGYLFIGENDLQYRVDNLTGIFEEHRPLGARWILAMEPGAGHQPITDRGLLDPYFRMVTRGRLPADLPGNAVPELVLLPEPSGWLGDRNLQFIGSWDCYDAASDSACWFPGRSIAKAWQDLVSAGAVSDTIACTTGAPTAPIRSAHLLPNRPNPFNPATVIVFELSSPAQVDLQIFDLGGRLVGTLAAREPLAAGRHERTWHGRNSNGHLLAAGNYVCSLRAGNVLDSRRLTLLK